jgi:methionyl-tRNA formyltransferase
VGAATGEPGTILLGKDGMNVVCDAGSLLEITHVKQEGRKEILAGDFARGARVQSGEKFGK